MRLHGPMPAGPLDWLKLYTGGYGQYTASQNILQQERRLVFDIDMMRAQLDVKQQELEIRKQELDLRKQELGVRLHELQLRERAELTEREWALAHRQHGGQ